VEHLTNDVAALRSRLEAAAASSGEARGAPCLLSLPVAAARTRIDSQQSSTSVDDLLAEEDFHLGEAQRAHHRTLLAHLSEHLAQLTGRVETEAQLRRKLEEERAQLFQQYSQAKAESVAGDSRRSGRSVGGPHLPLVGRAMAGVSLADLGPGDTRDTRDSDLESRVSGRSGEPLSPPQSGAGGRGGGGGLSTSVSTGLPRGGELLEALQV
jgi:hypothetical protein